MSKHKIKDYKLGNEEQEIQEYKGLRRVPVGDYLKLKKSSLLLYIYLQQISQWTEGESHRYILKDDLNIAEVQRATGLSRPTITAKLKVLAEVGMINYWTKTSSTYGNTDYILLPKVGDYYVLVDTSLRFVRGILELCDEVLLRIYLFHKSKSRANKKYSYTLTQISEEIGFCKNNESRISKANDILEGFDIIKQRKKYIKTKYGGVFVYEYIYLKD